MITDSWWCKNIWEWKSWIYQSVHFGSGKLWVGTMKTKSVVEHRWPQIALQPRSLQSWQNQRYVWRWQVDWTAIWNAACRHQMSNIKKWANVSWFIALEMVVQWKLQRPRNISLLYVYETTRCSKFLWLDFIFY